VFGLLAGNRPLDREARYAIRAADPDAEARVLEMVTHPHCDLVVTAIPGARALAPTLAALRAGKVVGLATKEAIPIRPEVAAVCAAAGIDPYISISEGTLVATVRPQHAEGLLAALAKANIPAADVGEVLPAGAARTMLDADGREVPLTPPRLDPYWEAFARWSAQ